MRRVPVPSDTLGESTIQQEVYHSFPQPSCLSWLLLLQVTPPDVLAAESLVDMAASQGWKLDRSFYGSVSPVSV